MNTPKLRPEYFESDKYDIISVLYSTSRTPVIVLRNKSADRASWCLIQGYSTMYFPTYQQIMDFCKKHEYTAEYTTDSKSSLTHQSTRGAFHTLKGGNQYGKNK